MLVTWSARQRPGVAWRTFFQAKRELLTRELSGCALRVHRAQGASFQLLDYAELDSADDLSFTDRLIRDAKVATIPLSVFYAEPPAMQLFRVCLAKSDDTLREAAGRLRSPARATRAGA